MTYAHRDDIYDADTHMMEHPSWIADFADPAIRDRVVPYLDGVEVMQEYVKDALTKFDQRRSSCFPAAPLGKLSMQKNLMCSSAAFARLIAAWPFSVKLTAVCMAQPICHSLPGRKHALKYWTKLSPPVSQWF